MTSDEEIENENLKEDVVIITPNTKYKDNPKKWAKETIEFISDIVNNGEK